MCRDQGFRLKAKKPGDLGGREPLTGKFKRGMRGGCLVCVLDGSAQHRYLIQEVLRLALLRKVEQRVNRRCS